VVNSLQELGPGVIETAKKEGWVDIWITLEEDGFVAVAEKLGIQVDRPKA